MGKGLSRAELPPGRVLVEASLWSADHARFAADMERVDPFVDLYHVDVSDDHFVPGLLLFPDLLATLRPYTRRPMHVHLMAEHPQGLVGPFAEAGADLVTVHAECGTGAAGALEEIRRRGMRGGIALRLETPVEQLAPYLDGVDLVLMMGTPVGVKGVDLSAAAVDRMRAARRLLAERGLAERVRLEADGGIRKHTAARLCGAGADVLVLGSLLFQSEDPGATTGWVRSFRPAPR